MLIRLTPAGEPPRLIWLRNLLESDDGLREEEPDIRAALDAGRPYHGGGGAAPEFTIERSE